MITNDMCISKVYLSLGSNSGKREEYLYRAVDAIGAAFDSIITCSHIFETAPWGNIDQPRFLNMCVGLNATESPAEVLAKVQDIEQRLGRVRTQHWGERTIDIDILFYGDLILRHPNLTLPHPHMPQRRFVLEPLNELAADFMHPVLKKTIGELLEECNDELQVELWNFR